MAAAGLDDSAVAVAPAYSRAAGQAATAVLLNARPGLTAIAASNDLLALGAYQELKRRGLSCPRDISVVGYNDMPLVDMVDPPLTTVRIAHAEMGRAAARQLLERLAEADIAACVQFMPVELVARSSTRRVI